jgi:HEAT repeat protein
MISRISCCAVFTCAVLLMCATAFNAGCFIYCPAHATNGCLTSDKIHERSAKNGPREAIALLEDSRSWVREEAVRTLGNMRAVEARPSLEARLGDRREKPYVRSAAAIALGQLGRIESIAVLVGVAGEPATPPDVKLSIIHSLCAVSELGPEPMQAIAPLANDEDLLVAAFAEQSVSTRCHARE